MWHLNIRCVNIYNIYNCWTQFFFILFYQLSWLLAKGLCLHELEVTIIIPISRCPLSTFRLQWGTTNYSKSRNYSRKQHIYDYLHVTHYVFGGFQSTRLEGKLNKAISKGTANDWLGVPSASVPFATLQKAVISCGLEHRLWNCSPCKTRNGDINGLYGHRRVCTPWLHWGGWSPASLSLQGCLL